MSDFLVLVWLIILLGLRVTVMLFCEFSGACIGLVVRDGFMQTGLTVGKLV